MATSKIEKIRQKLLVCQGEKEVIFEDCHKNAQRLFCSTPRRKRKSFNDYLIVIALPRL